MPNGEATQIDDAVMELGARDALIFHTSAPRRLSLVGGVGRGAGWGGIVEARLDDEPLAARVLASCKPLRVDDEEAVHIIGPYWATHALLVPVGAEHLVVFGGNKQWTEPDGAFLPVAAQLVSEHDQVAPAKLLADELELVHAIRDLMDCRPETVAATARHIAARSAEPLSCEVGAVLVRQGERLVAEVITRDWPALLDADAIRNTLVKLFERTEKGPILELELSSNADDALGIEQGLVARFALPIGRPAFGVLVVAHAATRARGFTNLCQRIGHALAEAAETLLIQALARETLTEDRDRFAREARVDPLTGLDNRAAWDNLISAEEVRRQRHERPLSVVSADLDNLKEINDRYGHPTGDELIRATADLLRRCARTSDRVARIGGDEFFVLLPETDKKGAARFLARTRAAARRCKIGQDIPVRLSLGAVSLNPGESLIGAVTRADAAMYESKRRRTLRVA